MVRLLRWRWNIDIASMLRVAKNFFGEIGTPSAPLSIVVVVLKINNISTHYPFYINFVNMAHRLMGPVLAARQNESNAPREPPPPATLLDFPLCSPQGARRKRQELDIEDLFSNMVRTGPKLTHLEVFNLQLENGITLEELLPSDALPPSSWLSDPALTESSDFTTTPPHEQTLSNGRTAPSNQVSIYRSYYQIFPSP